MIKINEIELNKHLYLGGIETAPNISFQQKRSIDGISELITKPLIGGRVLTLGTTNIEGKNQGIWCKEIIDEIKALELQNSVVSLNYYGTTYSVRIVDTTDFQQLYQWELPTPSKKFLGKIILIEV